MNIDNVWHNNTILFKVCWVNSFNNSYICSSKETNLKNNKRQFVMKHLTVDSIYDDIMLLSNADKQNLYVRMQKELYKKDEIVAFTTSGNPLSKKQYVEKIEKAIAEADRGELIIDGELRKEVETW